MNGPGRWRLAIAALALVVVGAAVMVAGTAIRDPNGRGGSAAPGDTGLARGGRAPRGQAPVVALTVPLFQNAFNADTGERRLLVILSPT